MSQCDKCMGIGYYDEGHENDDGSMSGGNYVACECEKNKSCTSDEWLTNATQSTRDLANKIKGQQLRGTGNQFRNETESELHAREIAELKSVLKAANSQTEEFERKWYLECDKSEKQTSRIKQLTGEHVVLINLLKEASTVIETIEADDWQESESLMDLINKMHAAFNAAMQGLIFKCQTCGQTEKYDHRGCETKVAS